MDFNLLPTTCRLYRIDCLSSVSRHHSAALRLSHSAPVASCCGEMATAEGINDKLKSAEQLGAVFVDVVDESGGCGAKFALSIAATKFVGMPLLERHRLVQTILADEMKTIHALTIKAYTPEVYEKKKAEGTL